MANNDVLKGLLPSTKGVNYTAVPLDPGTQGLINQDTALASRPSSDFASEANAGVQARADQGKQSDQQLKQEAQSTGQSDGMLSAIRNQYNNEASKGIGRIMDQNNVRGQLEKYQMTQQTAQAAMAQQNVMVQNYQGLTEAYNQSLMARAQVLSSIFSAGGVGAAMAIKSNGRRSAASQGGSSPLTGQSTQTNAMTDTYSNNGSSLA